MSEEEIRKILLCENIGELAYCGLLDKLDESNNFDLNELKKQAVQSLLDLYNKEKEKNKELSKRYDLLQLCYENDLSNSISKDKIREKIKELEENNLEIDFDWDSGDVINAKYEDRAKLDMLKELMEE